MPSSSRAQCALHPNEPAVETCGRCGTFLCYGCVLVLNATVCCAPCYGRTLAPPPPEPAPTRVYVALTLSVLGFAFFPFAVVAIGLGWLERRRILRGQASRSGERYARAAGLIGWFALAVAPALSCFMLRFFIFS